MFYIDSQRYFCRIFGAWFLFTLQAILAVGVQPEALSVPAILAVIWLTYYCINCAYRTGQFSKYASPRLFTNLGIAPGFAFVALLVVLSKQLKLGVVWSVLLSCTPLAVSLIVYVILRMRRSRCCMLVVKGVRVEGVAVASGNSWISGALSIALGALIYPMFNAFGSSASLLVFLFIVISFFMLFYHHASMPALRTLKGRERSGQFKYTFMNIEEIREMRTSDWIGRFLAPNTNL